MKKGQSILGALMFLALGLGIGWAQSDSGQQPGDSGQAPRTAPAPAFGQDNPVPQPSDNPPISGLDQPSLEPPGAARSYLLPGAQVSEAVDSNVGNEANASSTSEVTRALGSLTLQRLWRRYDLALDYVGVGAFYSGRNVNAAQQLHDLSVDQRILWRTGQLALRDWFSYLPEGSFGYGSFGGSGSLSGLGGGVAGGGLGAVGGGIGGNTFFGPGQFASLGQAPRMTNVAAADIVQSLTPRSSVTLAGSYGLVHFSDSNFGVIDNQPVTAINSRQVSAQAGYSYQLNRKDQIGLVYGYQDFRYPSFIGSRFDPNLLSVMYGHRISGRMDLVLGGGPQLTHIRTCISPLPGIQCVSVSNSRLSGAGRATLRYRFPKTSVGLSYAHYNTTGSGLFVGATSDVTRLDASRPLGRVWSGTANIGFTHNSRIAPNPFSSGVPGSSPSFANARAFDYLYAGAAVRRQLGKQFGLFISYQFNDLWFDSSFCGSAGTPCSRMSQRHVGLIGLDWHPRPIRLD
jgi:hypothetical protein